MQTRRTALGTLARACAATACVAAVAPLAHAAAPRRVVSLNPCLDVILVHVAARSQIAALSHYARDAQSSTIADIARTLPLTYESAEEIIGLNPDLVLASVHSSPATRQALARLHIDVATFGVPSTIAESLAQIREVADRIGRSARGAALVADVGGAMDMAARGNTRRPIRSLVFQPGGLVAGSGTLVDEAMRRVGFENVASRYGIQQWGTLSLERLIADPPELLLSAPPRPGVPSFAERLTSHPALRGIAQRMQRADFPQACLYCGGPVLELTARVLAEARERFWSVRA